MLRRNKFEIIGTILTICAISTNKTNIVYKTNLNFKITNKYLDLLICKNYIKRSGTTYMTTQSGKSLNKQLQDINKLFF